MTDRTDTAHSDSGAQVLEDLIAEMTLPEKLAQLGCVWSTQLVEDEGHDAGFSAEAAGRLVGDGIGQVTRIAASTGLRPQGLAELANEIQHWLLTETRLGIPAVIHEEAVAGFCARDAVQFPQAIGLAATFDTDLLGRIGAHIRAEMLAVGARHALAPVLDVARDPRWGRVEETYGEDPVLTGVLGTAYVRGLQNADGSDGLRGGVIATAKHFLGYAMSEGGMNHAPVHLGSRELREVYAEPFAAAIRDGGLESVMNSYASVDGLAPAGTRALLSELLRDELGFTGTVVADYFAVDLLRTHHAVAPTKGVAAAKALTAGMDQELPALDCYSMENLGVLVETGVVPMSTVDDSVRRVLRHKLELGLFVNPYVDAEVAAAGFGTGMGRDLARRAAEEAIVLLDNNGVVPLDAATISNIAVIGPAADDVRLTQGDYHYPAHLEIIYGIDTQSVDLLPEAGGAFAPGPFYPDTITPLAGLRAALADGVSVCHAPGCGVLGDDADGDADGDAGGDAGGDDRLIAEAAVAADNADVAVVCLAGRSGLTPNATVGEARDAMDLDPTGRQMDLLRAVVSTGTPTIAVICSGRVHTLGEVEQLADATLLAWPAGVEAGSALAAILLGHVAPSGRLPITLPRHVGQVPTHYAHRAGGGASQFWGDYADGPATPLHPFGFGLSTTEFTYGEPLVTAGTTTDLTTFEVELTNTGDRAGTEVVQLYARDEFASVARPVRQLVGFARVHLQPGESKAVNFALHPSRLAFFDEDFRFVCEPGAFDLEVGGYAGSPARTATVDLDGEVHQYRQRDVIATTVTIL